MQDHERGRDHIDECGASPGRMPEGRGGDRLGDGRPQRHLGHGTGDHGRASDRRHRRPDATTTHERRGGHDGRRASAGMPADAAGSEAVGGRSVAPTGPHAAERRWHVSTRPLLDGLALRGREVGDTGQAPERGGASRPAAPSATPMAEQPQQGRAARPERSPSPGRRARMPRVERRESGFPWPALRSAFGPTAPSGGIRPPARSGGGVAPPSDAASAPSSEAVPAPPSEALPAPPPEALLAPRAHTNQDHRERAPIDRVSAGGDGRRVAGPGRAGRAAGPRDLGRHGIAADDPRLSVAVDRLIDDVLDRMTGATAAVGGDDAETASGSAPSTARRRRPCGIIRSRRAPRSLVDAASAVGLRSDAGAPDPGGPASFLPRRSDRHGRRR